MNDDSIDKKNLRSDKSESHWSLYSSSKSSNSKRSEEKKESFEKEKSAFASTRKTLHSPILGQPSKQNTKNESHFDKA